VFAALAVWAGIADGWIPSAVLGAVSVLVVLSMMRDCAAATGTWRSTLDDLADGREVFSMSRASMNGASPSRGPHPADEVRSASNGQDVERVIPPSRDIASPARGMGMGAPSPRLAREGRLHLSERED
jgi:hypothetical protein